MEFYYDEIDDDVLIIKVDGGLNVDTAEQFVLEIGALVDSGLQKVIVDCSKLEYISSYGVGILVRLHRRMKRQGGDVKIAAVRSVLSDVLRLTRLNTLFEIYPDVNRAKLAFRPTSTQPETQ